MRRKGISAAVLSVCGLALACAPSAWALAVDDAHVVSVGEVAEANSVTDEPVQCPAGERALSGGASIPGGSIAVSNPLDSGGTTSGTDDGDIPRYWYTAVNNP